MDIPSKISQNNKTPFNLEIISNSPQTSSKTPNDWFDQNEIEENNNNNNNSFYSKSEIPKEVRNSMT